MSQSEAQRRAEARRAKILARGNAGLAKLASTARGEEASVLYDSKRQSLSLRSTSHAPRADATPSRTPTPSARPAQPAEDPSAAYQANLERTMAALGASSSDRRQDAGTVDPMQAFQEMMNKMGTGQNMPSMENVSVDPTEDPPTPELPPTRLPAINDSPFGFPPSAGGEDMSSMFSPEMMQILQNAGGAPGSSPFAAAPPAATEKTLLARLMPLIHVLTISVFFAFTILIWEPSVWASGAGAGRAVVQTIGGREKRWSGLRGDSGGLASDVLTSGWASLVSHSPLSASAFIDPRHDSPSFGLSYPWKYSYIALKQCWHLYVPCCFDFRLIYPFRSHLHPGFQHLLRNSSRLSLSSTIVRCCACLKSLGWRRASLAMRVYWCFCLGWR